MMKQFCLVLLLIIIFGILSLRLFGQNSRPVTIPAAKIALIDSDQFGDESLGIKVYVRAMKSLQQEFKGKTTDADKAAFQKRYTEVIDPLVKDMGKALDQFAAERGITLTLDVTKVAILTADPATDITAPFIADYNRKHPAVPGS